MVQNEELLPWNIFILVEKVKISGPKVLQIYNINFYIKYFGIVLLLIDAAIRVNSTQ